MLLLVGTAAEGHIKFYLKMGKYVKLIWLKAKEPREVKKKGSL